MYGKVLAFTQWYISTQLQLCTTTAKVRIDGLIWFFSQNGFIIISYVMWDQANLYYYCWMAIVLTIIILYIEAIKLARENNVIIFTLVPHAHNT